MTQSVRGDGRRMRIALQQGVPEEQSHALPSSPEYLVNSSNAFNHSSDVGSVRVPFLLDAKRAVEVEEVAQIAIRFVLLIDEHEVL